MAVITDNINIDVSEVTASVASVTDYYPFGLSMEGRTYSSNIYRYGFNGKEKDDNGEWGQTHYDYGFRIYNPGIAKFLSVDPLTKSYPMLTPYQYASNRPIDGIDLDGLEWSPYQNYHTYKFMDGFGTSIAKGTWNTISYAVNNSNFAGYGYSPDMKPPTEAEIAQYRINWSQQLDPYYQARNFAESSVLTVQGVYQFGEGISEGDGEKTAQAIPEVLGAIGTVYGLRLSTSSFAKFKLPKAAKTTVNSSIKGLDIRSATLVESIEHGSKLDDLVQKAKTLTYENGVEHAVIQLTDGSRQLVSGGKHGIILPENTDILFGHTHPVVGGRNNFPSLGDREALDALDQSKQYIFHDGQRTTIYRGKDSSYDSSTTDY